MTILTLKSHTHSLAAAAIDHFAHFVETLPDKIVALVYLWQTRATERRKMAQLDDRLLVDMGLDRVDIEREASKPFWRK